jgi:hypothetical protein
VRCRSPHSMINRSGIYPIHCLAEEYFHLDQVRTTVPRRKRGLPSVVCLSSSRKNCTAELHAVRACLIAHRGDQHSVGAEGPAVEKEAPRPACVRGRQSARARVEKRPVGTPLPPGMAELVPSIADVTGSAPARRSRAELEARHSRQVAWNRDNETRVDLAKLRYLVSVTPSMARPGDSAAG